MFVLDYLKSSIGNTIIVPPFHTGHLGFIPGSEVTVALLKGQSETPDHCEVLVTPFHQAASELVRISCTMLDDIGVVGSLIQAISNMDINITNFETSSIDRLKHHTVNMIVDFSTARLPKEETKRSTIRLYSKFESVLPLHDARYVTVFESIVAHCADKLVWTSVLGRNLPQLSIQPIRRTELGVHLPTTIRSAIDVKSIGGSAAHPVTVGPYHIAIDLPDRVAGQIRRNLGQPMSSPLKYVVISDTDERNLRVFFPTPKSTERLIHLGFYHTDEPGVLARITDAVARAQFSIVTSLVRNVNPSQNVWEALMEYKGDNSFPSQAGTDQVCIWASEQIIRHSSNPHQLLASRIEIGAPRYPRKQQWQGTILVNEHPLAKQATPRPIVRPSIQELLVHKISGAAKVAADSAPVQAATKLLELVQRRTSKSALPRIFVSYPKNAVRHALALRKQLDGKYEWDEYQDPDGEDIVSQVQNKITDCDYFIGIWHHDESLPASPGKYNVSPWMPFEYGIAIAESKKSIVIHSEKVDERVWRRINANIANPEYSDLHFLSDTVPKVVGYCAAHFR